MKALRLSLDALFPTTPTTSPAQVFQAFTLDDIVQLVVASYLLDYPKLFETYTSWLVTDYTKPMIEVVQMGPAHRVPTEVWREWRAFTCYNWLTHHSCDRKPPGVRAEELRVNDLPGQ